jgi:hypothetical protein
VAVGDIAGSQLHEIAAPAICCRLHFRPSLIDPEPAGGDQQLAAQGSSLWRLIDLLL